MGISEALVETLIGITKDETRKEMEFEARAYLDVTPHNYGEISSSLCVMRAETMLELRRKIRDRRWRRNGDNPGQQYSQSCELLKVVNNGAEYTAITIVSNHFDV